MLYIERWLQAPAQEEDGRLVPREKGAPQGGVISPLPANLFLHYAFDRWLAEQYPDVMFERYADDAIVPFGGGDRRIGSGSTSSTSARRCRTRR